jgi:hypothetical protein
VPPSGLRPRDLVILQHSAGNQAVGRLLRFHASEQRTPPAAEPARAEATPSPVHAEPVVPARRRAGPMRWLAALAWVVPPWRSLRRER